MPRKRTKKVTEDTPIADETVVDEAKTVAPAEPVAVAEPPEKFAGQIVPPQQEKAEPALNEASEHTPIAPDRPASGHIANPSSVRRPSHAEAVRRLPTTLSLNAGDLRVDLVDKGDNLAGIGVGIATPEGRKLTEEEKEVIREHMRFEAPNNPAFTWRQQAGIWVKPIVRENEFEDEVPPARAIAVRLDGERRVAAIAEDLRQLQADPVGFAGMVRSRREHAAEAGRIPD